ncbi:hypothetical protein ACJO5Y_15105 [Marinobacter sp. GN3S48]|uniref:hypothetical protein n=1 Tax=Marinobacter sp. GN3S48 TaxID=3382302 RepID=UPI00387AED1D
MSDFFPIDFYKRIVDGRRINKNIYNQKRILDEFFSLSKKALLAGGFEVTLDIIEYFIKELKESKDIIVSDLLALCLYARRDEKLYRDSKKVLNDLYLEYLLETSIRNLISIVRNPRQGFIDKSNKSFWSLKDPFLVQSFNDISSKVSRYFEHGSSEKSTCSNVVVYVEDISPIRNQTGTKLVLDYLHSLSTSSEIDEVTLVVGHGNSLSMVTGVSGYSFRCNKFDIKDKLRKDYGLIGENVDVLYLTEVISEGDGYLEEVGRVMCSLSPSVIVYFDYRPSIIISALAKAFPTVYVPMQVGLSPAVKPTIECVMAHDERVKNTAAPKNYYHVIERQISYPLSDNFELQERGFPEVKGNRLITAAYDIDKRVEEKRLHLFLRHVSDFLGENDGWSYTILGLSQESGIAMLKKAGVLSDVNISQFEFIKNEPNFVKKIRSSDVFIMPYHKGGGRAVRTAIEQGVAVLTLDNNDGNLYLHDDFIFKSEGALFEFLRELVSDDEALEICRSKCKKFYEGNDNDQLLKKFVVALSRAKDNFKNKKVLILGDSHSQYFSYANFFENHQVFFSTVYGATASGLYNERSKTNARDKFLFNLANINPELVILCLGEVDVGFLAWKKRSLNGEDIFSRLSKALLNIKKYALELAQSVEKVIVLSVPLPTVQDGVDRSLSVPDNRVQRESVYASYKERIGATKLFNEQMDYVLASIENVRFINLDPLIMNAQGRLKPEILKRDPSDHHYNPIGFCSVLEKNLVDKVILGEVND